MRSNKAKRMAQIKFHCEPKLERLTGCGHAPRKNPVAMELGDARQAS
jgi:hypothetical protein